MNQADKEPSMPRRTMVIVATLMVGVGCLWASWTGTALAGPTRVVATQFTEPVQLWADSAKAPTPTSTVIVRKGTCNLAAAAMACANYDPMTATGTITMMPGLTGVGAQKIFLHELGHVFDGRHFYPSDRLEVTRLLGFPAGTPWGGLAGQASPSEWFAEAASLCYLGWWPASVMNYGFKFSYSSPQVQGVCGIMKRAVKQPARELTSFSSSLPPSQQFRSVTTFDPGTITATVTVGGRSVKSVSSCTDQVKSSVGAVFVNTCGNRVSAWSFASSKATITVQGVPAALPVSLSGSLSAIVQPRDRRVSRSPSR